MSPVQVKLGISGLQELQDENARSIAALQPGGALGQAVKHVTAGAHRYTVAITHVDTGALRASHRMEVQGLRGRIYIDPTARNPRSGQRTSVYGPFEHARGGEHAFYDRAAEESGPRLVREAQEIIERAVVYGR